MHKFYQIQKSQIIDKIKLTRKRSHNYLPSLGIQPCRRPIHGSPSDYSPDVGSPAAAPAAASGEQSKETQKKIAKLKEALWEDESLVEASF